VVAQPILNVHQVLGTVRGKFSSHIEIIPYKALRNVIGIWVFGEKVYILRKHPGLQLLSVEESGQSADNENKEMEEGM